VNDSSMPTAAGISETETEKVSERGERGEDSRRTGRPRCLHVREIGTLQERGEQRRAARECERRGKDEHRERREKEEKGRGLCQWLYWAEWAARLRLSSGQHHQSTACVYHLDRLYPSAASSSTQRRLHRPRQATRRAASHLHTSRRVQ
jgi:hypothetical protein